MFRVFESAGSDRVQWEQPVVSVHEYVEAVNSKGYYASISRVKPDGSMVMFTYRGDSVVTATLEPIKSL